MTGIPFTKVMIDTRFKTTDSNSNSDFRYQLNRTGFMPEGTTFCIDEINIPYSWNTIETGINDQLYISYRQLISNPEIPRIITITPQRFTGVDFATNLGLQLNSMGGPGIYVATYNTNSNTITITSNNMYFKIWTDQELLQSTIFTGLNVFNLNSVNEVLQVYGLYTGGINGYVAPGVGFQTGFLNLLNYQDLYITSTNLGNFQSMGPRGESTVLRKVMVNVAWGFSIIDKESYATDFLSCSKISLSTLDFQLRDVRGNIVPLHGANMSFSIRFLAPQQ
jgi:hypothetical protein